MRKKMDPGAIFDAFPEGQTMTRADFIKECNDLTCPHKKVQDLTRMTMERGRQRTLGLFAKNEIDKAVKEKLR